LRTLKINTLYRFLAVAICIAASLQLAQAQRADSYARTRPFELGEELHFEAEFSRSLLRKLDVADLKFRAGRSPLKDTTKDLQQTKPYALTFSADIASKGFFARLFNLKFRERVESTVEPVSFTVERTTILDEQGKRVFIGDGGRVYKIPVKVVEKKRMKTVLGRVNVLRVNPELFGPERLIDEEKGEFSIWITDDARHIPVEGRIKTEYGTFEIKLKRIITNPAAAN
jgi:hypothetical protein